MLASIDGSAIRPWISAYLLIMGIVVIAKALHWRQRVRSFKWAPALGLVGGFLDAIAAVAGDRSSPSTLIGHGGTPRHVIGTVNTTSSSSPWRHIGNR